MAQNPTTVTFPFGTTIYMYGYTNAFDQQKAAIKFDDGTVVNLAGKGEGNAPMSPPVATYKTPKSGTNPNGVRAQVVISNQSGNPQPSIGAGLTVGSTTESYLVTSEDSTDSDWNDAVVHFLWYPPKPTR